MFCGKGTACCLDEHHGTAVSSSSPQKCSCCCHETDQPQKGPDESPERSDELCQGICGGVVMFESIKLDTRDDLLHAVPFEVVSDESCPAETCLEQPDEFAPDADPSGRSLRAMLSSYLC
jgi:hypothetical protein